MSDSMRSDRPEYERSLNGDAIPQKPLGGDAVTRPAHEPELDRCTKCGLERLVNVHGYCEKCATGKCAQCTEDL